jgi:hypothetical protein
MSIDPKNAVLEEIAKGATVEYTKKAKVRIGKSKVHFRNCSPQAAARGSSSLSSTPIHFLPISN